MSTAETPQSTAQSRRPRERPEEILDAALTVFSEKGYSPATMDAIAREAGITKGTIYLYFESKEELFVAMVRAKLRAIADLLPAVAFEPGMDFAQMLRQTGEKYLEIMMTPRAAQLMTLVIGQYNHVPALRSMYLDEVIPQGNLELARLLELGQQMGLVRPLDPIIAARGLFGMFFIFVLTQEVFGAKAVTPMTPAAIAETVASIWLEGVIEKGTSS